ncbi:hypothetical protein IAT38_000353 [Cryptococcus sp. DSM 104549]
MPLILSLVELTRWCTRHERYDCHSTCYVIPSHIPPLTIQPIVPVPLPIVVPSRFAYIPGTHTPTPTVSTSSTLPSSLPSSPRSSRPSSSPPSRIHSFVSLSTLVPILSATETIFEEPEPIEKPSASGLDDVGAGWGGHISDDEYDENERPYEAVWMRPTRTSKWKAPGSMDNEGPEGADDERPLGLGLEWYVVPGDVRSSGGTEQCWGQDVVWHVQKALSRAGIDLGGIIRRQPSRMMSLKPESPEGSSDETLCGAGEERLELANTSSTPSKSGILFHTSLPTNTSPSSFNSALTLCDEPQAIGAASTSRSKRVSFADDAPHPPRQASDRRTSSVEREESSPSSGFMDKVRRRSSSLGLGGLFRSPPSTLEVMPAPSPTPSAGKRDGIDQAETIGNSETTEEAEIDVYRLPPSDSRRRYRHHDLPGYSARFFEKQHAFIKDYY